MRLLLKMIFASLVFTFSLHAEESSFKEKTQEFLRDRLAIGFRSEYFKLETEKDDYIGSIDKLGTRQNYDPRLFLQVHMARYAEIDWSLELTYTRVAMDTLTTYALNQNDGTLKLSGPVFLLNGRYPNKSRFTPYGVAGMVYFNHTEVSEGWWHYGFTPENDDWRTADAEYREWRRNGSQSWPNGGFTRTFELDPTWGSVFGAGCSIRLWDHVDADCAVKYVNATTDNTYTMAFYGDPVDVRYSEFDISHYNISAGLKYEF